MAFGYPVPDRGRGSSKSGSFRTGSLLFDQQRQQNREGGDPDTSNPADDGPSGHGAKRDIRQVG